jgi:hypothetical protein
MTFDPDRIFSRAAILAAFQMFRRMGIHREFLPNCIVVARRSR